jgi:DNA-binding MarR family transcriptional regulator
MRRFLQSVLEVAAYERELTFRQVAVLGLCVEVAQPVERQIHAIASYLAVSRPVVSRAADVLEEAGLVKRGVLDSDKRTCVLTVTRDGQKFWARITGEPALVSAPRRRKPETYAAA